jgi:hypothetical protein
MFPKPTSSNLSAQEMEIKEKENNNPPQFHKNKTKLAQNGTPTNIKQ